MAGFGDFRPTGDWLGPTYQALGSLVPNAINAYKGGLGLFRDQQRRDALTALGPNATPQSIGQAMLKLGEIDPALAAIRLGELQEDRGLARQKLDLEIKTMNQGIQERADAARMLRGIFGGGNPPSGQPASGGFPKSLISSESGGRWDAQNDEVGAGGARGHFGRLQFGHARLQEAAAAGAIPQGTSPQQFMQSTELQKRAEQWHFGDIDQKIKANGLDRAIGQSINGVPVTLDGMRAVAHLGGSEGLRKFITSGGQYDPADANGTRLSDYLKRHAGPSAQPQAANYQQPEPVQMAQAQTGQTNDASRMARMTPQELESLAINPAINKNFPAVAALTKEEMKRREAANQPTNEMKNLAAMNKDRAAAGLPPLRKDEWELQRARAARPVVNIDTKGETKLAEKNSEAIAARFKGIAEEGDKAIDDKAMIGQLRELGGQFQTGGWANLVAKAAEVGIKLPGASQVEAYSALIDKLTPQQRLPGSGATSDFDARMFKASLPRLINTPEGNRIIVDTMDALADNRLRRGEIAGLAQIGEMPPKEAFRQLNELQKEARKLSDRVVEAARKGAPAAPPAPGARPAAAKPENEAEYARLPAGSQYIAPDGSVRTKK